MAERRAFAGPKFYGVGGKLEANGAPVESSIETRFEATTNKYKDFFLNAREGFFQLSWDGKLVEINPAFAKILGFKSVEDALANFSKAIDYFVHPNDLRQIIDRLVKYGTIQNFEAQIFRQDDKVVWVSVSAQCYRDDRGHITHSEGIFSDITQQKRVTADLERAKQKAEIANITKSQFLSNMSHEIRTPLNAMLGMSQLLLETELSEEQEKYVNIFKMSGENLLSIINDLLDISKIELGRVSLKNQKSSIQELIQKTFELMKPLADEKGIKFVCNLDKNLPGLVECDCVRIRQILTNLINNAIKFTDKGGVTLNTLKVGEDDGSVKVQFEVIDTGIGINQKMKKSIYEPFHQGDTSITRKYGGTGLGLSISKQLAEIMGGKITHESSENEGSRFIFTVTLDVVRPLENGEPTSSPHLLPIPKEARVLLVDDSEENCFVVESFLGESDLKIDVCHNGKEALELVRKNPDYDLILMDIEMPVMNGYDAAQAIRRFELSISKLPTPIIALTAHSLSEHMELSRRYGFNGFLTKPFSKNQLFETVVKWTTPHDH